MCQIIKIVSVSEGGVARPGFHRKNADFSRPDASSNKRAICKGVGDTRARLHEALGGKHKSSVDTRQQIWSLCNGEDEKAIGARLKQNFFCEFLIPAKPKLGVVRISNSDDGAINAAIFLPEKKDYYLVKHTHHRNESNREGTHIASVRMMVNIVFVTVCAFFSPATVAGLVPGIHFKP